MHRVYLGVTWMNSVGKMPARGTENRIERMPTYQLVSILVQHPQITGETNPEESIKRARPGYWIEYNNRK